MTKVFVGPKRCVGPSQISSILGYNRYLSAAELKSNLESGYMRERDTPATRYGKKYEKLALTIYQKYRKHRVIKPHFGVDPLCSRFVGMCDGLVSSEDGDLGGVEIKCHYSGKILESIPSYYMVQIVAYMYLYKRKWWDLVSCSFDENGKRTGYKIFRVHWGNHEMTWNKEWYPKIMKFISNVEWAKK